MKLYKGKKRIAMKRSREHAGIASWILKDHEKQLIQYLSTAKPGDLIGACTGYNHYIAKIEFQWAPSKNKKNRWVQNIRVIDDTGRWHWFSSAGCIQMPYTREEIESEILEMDTEEEWAWIKESEEWSEIKKNIETLKNGNHVVDEKGVKL